MDSKTERIQVPQDFQPSADNIKELILTIRGMQVLLDSDVARLYGYETKAINLAAKRNDSRFPSDFRFQLTEEEFRSNLRFQTETSSSEIGMRFQSETASKRNKRHLPFAYSEHGIVALAGVLRNETAAEMSVFIARAFVEMRRLININSDVFSRMTGIDIKLLEHDRKFGEVFDLLRQPKAIKQSIFYKGQFYDAYTFVIGLVKQAKSSIVLIDNYADDSVLEMLGQKGAEVSIKIITSNPNKLIKQNLEKFSPQHGPIEVIQNNDFHDRFLIIDNAEVYVFGASFKDLGNKNFGVFMLEDCAEMLIRINRIH